MSKDIQIAFNHQDLHAGLKLFQEDAVRIVRASVRRIGESKQKDLEAYLPERTGRMKRALHVRTRFVSARTLVKSTVSVDTVGKADNPRNAFYWRFVEFGHLTRPSRKEGGAPQRFIAGSGVLQRQWAALQQTASIQFFTDLARALNKRYTKEARKGGT
jgi:hypothetical protein